MQAVNPRHHLGEATLLSYAAGALPAALAIVATTHSSMCTACRRQLRMAERIGGGLIALQHESAPPAGAREAMLARLDACASSAAPALGSFEDAAAVGPDTLPVPLHPYFGRSLAGLPWRWMAAGMQGIRAGIGEGTLLMLRVAPGEGIPMHGHHGSEFTCVLQGAYDDEFGRFSAGDLAELGTDDRHRPVMASDMPCICIVGLDGDLHCEGCSPQALQPLFVA